MIALDVVFMAKYGVSMRGCLGIRRLSAAAKIIGSSQKYQQQPKYQQPVKYRRPARTSAASDSIRST